MSLVTLDIPEPQQLRGGWAAMAAVCAARGWNDSAYAEKDQWLYHDGGGNWACLRFQHGGRVVMLGHDHEYSETYYGEAAEYFQEEETDLLAAAPDWWAADLNPQPLGEWLGFVYGWDGLQWQRAAYDLDDGFISVGLVDMCCDDSFDLLRQFASDAPGLNGEEPDAEALRQLVAADGNITAALLGAVVPGWDIEAGVAAGRKFLLAKV